MPSDNWPTNVVDATWGSRLDAGVCLTARITDDMVRCSGMVSNKEDKGFRYGYPVTLTIKAPAPLRSRGSQNQPQN
ncbi:hypothetical protein B296_00003128 [Ensete ventricosum]|uniref:Uncharacterized protein n=1 Tax=Ensete ventricosum TaxID=4639 RepID=A0A426ZLF5_ENSVE|nr:hypothetical protein B296_00003128 [Ensete ventricosum]